MTNHLRPVWAEIDLGAVRRNAARLKSLVAPAELCAVVKAQAYGHGPVRVAEAALAGGATWLGVALVEEGIALRRAQITEPVLVLSEPATDAAAWEAVVRHRLTPTVYTMTGVDLAAKAVVAVGDEPLPVHVKVDTGMHRVGASPDDAVELARAIDARPELSLDGLFTHFAVADEVDDAGAEFTAAQVASFRSVVERAPRARLLHACNSAGVLTRPEACFDLARCGIALYGLAPAPALAARCADLEPVMSVKAKVSFVKRVAAGERASYGLRYRFDRASWVATVPIGYADGVPRRLDACGGEVLVGGRRRPIAGTVTMDQLLVDCGDDESVRVGDEVVLIGRQGNDSISAWEWAERTGTIAYEIVCGISARVPRVWT